MQLNVACQQMYYDTYLLYELWCLIHFDFPLKTLDCLAYIVKCKLNPLETQI